MEQWLIEGVCISDVNSGYFSATIKSIRNDKECFPNYRKSTLLPDTAQKCFTFLTFHIPYRLVISSRYWKMMDWNPLLLIVCKKKNSSWGRVVMRLLNDHHYSGSHLHCKDELFNELRYFILCITNLSIQIINIMTDCYISQILSINENKMWIFPTD